MAEVGSPVGLTQDNQYIGKPCRQGHTLRYKHSKNCVVCSQQSNEKKKNAPGARQKATDYARDRYQNDPEFRQRQRDSARKRYERNPDFRQRRVEAARLWSSDPANRQRKREGSLKRNFGIDGERYQKMLTAQDGVCACCGKPSHDGRALAVDHNHTTGKIRDLLCSRCNVAIGILESPLASVWLAYLEKHNGN